MHPWTYEYVQGFSLQQPESSQQANTKDMGPKKAREKKGDLYENYFTGRKCTGSRG